MKLFGKRVKINLLVKILVAILLGVAAGEILPLWAARLFATFNSIFSQFLGFLFRLCGPGYLGGRK